MKINDLVICIREINGRIKGKRYRLLMVNDISVFVISDEKKNQLSTDNLFYLKMPEFQKDNKYMGSSFSHDYNLFNDYFITEQEYRKLKLTKLNESR